MTNKPLQEDATMEELLTTIRSVIAGEPQAESPSVKSSYSASEDDEDVLELTDEIQDDGTVTSLQTPSSQGKVSPSSDVLAQIDQAIDQLPTQKENLETQPNKNAHISRKLKDIVTTQTESLLSQESMERSADSIRNLVSSVPKFQPSGVNFRSGVTLEDLVIEAMKPELSKWLNEHLPPIVKHIVEKEIRRLIPQAEESNAS